MGTTQYIGARYVPLFADPNEWNSTRTYEPLTIVLHEGNSYTSRQYVPIGIDIDNDTYWVLTGNYNAQVEEYRKDVTHYAAQVNEVTKNLNSEITRATDAEKVLTDNLAAEITRATDAEKVLTDNLAAEITRATDAEKVLTDNLKNKINTYDTVADMVNASVTENSYVQTCGYYAVNDNGGALYHIESGKTANDMNIINVNNNLCAVLQDSNVNPNILQYGAKMNDSAYASKNCDVFDFFKNSNCCITVPSGDLYLNRTVDCTYITLNCVGYLKATESDFNATSITTTPEVTVKSHFKDIVTDSYIIKPVIKIGNQEISGGADALILNTKLNNVIKIDCNKNFLTGVYINNVSQSTFIVKVKEALQCACCFGSNSYENTLNLCYHNAGVKTANSLFDNGEALFGLWSHTSDVTITNIEGRNAMCGAYLWGARQQVGTIHVYTAMQNSKHPDLSVSAIIPNGAYIQRFTVGDKLAMYVRNSRNQIYIETVRYVIGDTDQKFIKFYDTASGYNTVTVENFNVRFNDNITTYVKNNYNNSAIRYILTNFYYTMPTIDTSEKYWHDNYAFALVNIVNFMCTEANILSINVHDILADNNNFTIYHIPFKSFTINFTNATSDDIYNFMRISTTPIFANHDILCVNTANYMVSTSVIMNIYNLYSDSTLDVFTATIRTANTESSTTTAISVKEKQF